MLFFVFVSWGLQRFIRENKSEERRACAAQRASRAARALGGMGGSRDGGGGPRNPSPPSPEALSDPSGAFFDLFCRVWGVVVGRNSLGKNAP